MRFNPSRACTELLLVIQHASPVSCQILKIAKANCQDLGSSGGIPIDKWKSGEFSGSCLRCGVASHGFDFTNLMEGRNMFSRPKILCALAATAVVIAAAHPASAGLIGDPLNYLAPAPGVTTWKDASEDEVINYTTNAAGQFVALNTADTTVHTAYSSNGVYYAATVLVSDFVLCRGRSRTPSPLIHPFRV